MKIVLCLAVIFLFGLIGFGIAGSYMERKKFFFSFNNFLELIKSDINFSSKKIGQIIDETILICRDKNFLQLLKNYKNEIKNNLQIEKENLFFNINILSEQEKESIYLFFKRLGRVDISSQTESINQIKNKCDEYYKQAQDEYKKYGSLYTKLGIVFGAFVALIIF